MTLLEKNAELGGNFRIAAYPTGKGQLTEAVRSMIVRCENAGVDIRTGVEADETVLKAFCPDAIVLATGSNPLILRIPGLAECGFMTAQELLDGKRVCGKKALVVGGGMVGCEAAEFLAERGHEVSVIEMKDVIAADVTPESRRYMFEAFREHNVGLYPGAKVGQFHTDGVDYTLADRDARQPPGLRQHRPCHGLARKCRAQGDGGGRVHAGPRHRRGSKGPRQRGHRNDRCASCGASGINITPYPSKRELPGKSRAALAAVPKDWSGWGLAGRNMKLIFFYRYVLTY